MGRVGTTWLVLGAPRLSPLLTLLSRLSQVAHPILPCESRQQKSRGGATPAAAGGGALRPVSLSAVRTRWREGRGAAPGGGRPVARGKPSSGFGAPPPPTIPSLPGKESLQPTLVAGSRPRGPAGRALGAGAVPAPGSRE